MDEVSFALEVRKTVIPVVHRGSEIPFRLRRLQYVDFQQDYDHGLSRLLKVLASPQKPLEPRKATSPEVRDQVGADIPEKRANQIEAERGLPGG